MAIEYRVPWNEASGRLQYGLNTPDGVNMVVLLVQETLEKNRDHCAMTVDGENAFNSIKRQRVLDRLYATFPELALFVETWYLDLPIWFYMDDHTVGIILSAEGIQQGDVIATFLFSNTYGPLLERILLRLQALSREAQVLAILDDITATFPVQLAAQAFAIFTEELSMINIRTVARKSHILVNSNLLDLIPPELDSQVLVHTDSTPLLGTALGDENFIGTFLRDKLGKSEQLLREIDRLHSKRAKYQILKLSISTKSRHLLRSLPISRPSVADFCLCFDQLMQNFFCRNI